MASRKEWGMKGLRKAAISEQQLARYVCARCDLIFLPLEVEAGRYSIERDLCARCAAVLLSQQGKLSLPPCFGVSYDGMAPECHTACGLRQACVVAYADASTKGIQWDTGRRLRIRPYSSSGGGGLSVSDVVYMVLRAAARPLHVKDVGPLVQRHHGEWVLSLKSAGEYDQRWRTEMHNRFGYDPEIVVLGGGFAVWIGAWHPRMGGAVAKKCSKKEHEVIEVTAYSLFSEDTEGTEPQNTPSYRADVWLDDEFDEEGVE